MNMQYMENEFEGLLENIIIEAIHTLFGEEAQRQTIQIQNTRKEFTGDFTIVVFPLLRWSKKGPEETAQLIGKYLQENVKEVEAFNVIKGFLNLELQNDFWQSLFHDIFTESEFGHIPLKTGSAPYMVEYSSPNTNKPLHLGHIRNNLLGFSVSKILEAGGHKVIKTNIVNDRGIHICKSMFAYEKWGKNEKPSSTLKGDKLVGNYYVKFETKSKEQRNTIKNNWAEVAIRKNAGILKKYNKNDLRKYFKEITNKLVSKNFENEPIRILKEIKSEFQTKNIDGTIKDYIILRINGQINDLYINKAQKILQKWEKGDPSVLKLWKKMNGWVYEGFEQTYKRLGVAFEETDYESKTYKVGKKLVEEALLKDILKQNEDGSVWVDLTEDGLDEKVLLRADGTAVYMTQDLGTAFLRYKNRKFKEHIYVVGNEQNYHFQVLKLILKKMGYQWSDHLFHLSYGMVELPEGKMKSREGKVVDADDLIDEMLVTAKEMSEELGKLDDYSEEEKNSIYRKVGMGALKYFILKVDPKKNMTFDPRESIDFNGNTGPFIQYTYARIISVLRKAEERKITWKGKILNDTALSDKEKELVKLIRHYRFVVAEAAKNYSPALIANYCYDLVKEYNQFYHDYSILREENAYIRVFRLQLSEMTARVIKSGMDLLGIEVPERM